MAFITLDRHQQRRLAGFGAGLTPGMLWKGGVSPTEQSIRNATQPVTAGQGAWIPASVGEQTVQHVAEQQATASGFFSNISNEQVIALAGGAVAGLALVYLLA